MILTSMFAGGVYGVTMKIADLLNEHGLKSLFFGSNLIFGILWGGVGVWLMTFDIVLANIVLAMTIAFIPRNRLDFLNHQIAALLIIVYGLLFVDVDVYLFFNFLITFIVFGFLKDKTNLKKVNIAYLMFESMLYYPIPTFIYGIASNNWIPFVVLTMYTIMYNLTKLYFWRKGYQ